MIIVPFREKVKQIPDEDVMAKESVKMVQRQETAVVAFPYHEVLYLTSRLFRIIEQTFAVIRSVCS